MDLRQLRYFATVAEELHFGRAARRLFISQPALSFDIRRLEETLGVKLLTRSSKEVHLTQAGRTLLEKAKSLLRDAEELKQTATRYATGSSGQIRIGFINSMLYRGLPEIVRQFAKTAPDIDIALKEMSTWEQICALEHRQIDIGCAHNARFPESIMATSILSEPFVCCLPQDHRLAGQGTISLAALKNERFILFSRTHSPYYYDLILAQCAASGFIPEIRHEVRVWKSVLSMVEMGMGVALIPSSLKNTTHTAISYHPFQGVTFDSELLLIQRRDTEQSAALNQLIHQLVCSVKQQG